MQQISYTSSSKSNFWRNFKRIAVVCATLGLIAGGIYVHSRMVRRDDVTEEKSSFFNDRNYDVLFFGTSHVRMGCIPFQLWKDYGITSYNLAVSAMQIDTAYYAIKEACYYHKPKIAVLDVYSCRLNYPDVDEETAVSRFQFFQTVMFKNNFFFHIPCIIVDGMKLHFVFHTHGMSLAFMK